MLPGRSLKDVMDEAISYSGKSIAARYDDASCGGIRITRSADLRGRGICVRSLCRNVQKSIAAEARSYERPMVGTSFSGLPRDLARGLLEFHLLLRTMETEYRYVRD